MRTIRGSLVGLVLLFGLSGAANAQPPPVVIGSWSCDLNGPSPFLVSFHGDGTLIATGPERTTSQNHGTWKRTGLNTFKSLDLAFVYNANGTMELIQQTLAVTTMQDNDNMTAVFDITITEPDGTMVDSFTGSTICARIKI